MPTAAVLTQKAVTQKKMFDTAMVKKLGYIFPKKKKAVLKSYTQLLAINNPQKVAFQSMICTGNVVTPAKALKNLRVWQVIC